MVNPLLKLKSFNQSIWLDFISRDLIDKKELDRLIKQDYLTGITSNPVIFEKAISNSSCYDQFIISLLKKGYKDHKFIFEQLAIKDIQDAADILYPVYEGSFFVDGMVSFEVSPHLAYDHKNTIIEAKRLFDQIKRPNVMIKVPGTKEGMLAIKELIKEGVNVNVTLLFNIENYKMAVRAYLEGLSERLNNGLAIDKVISVASFFISRIDSKVDKLLGGHKEYLGRVAISNAKLAYLEYEKIFEEELFKNLEAKGAHKQRLLWASTGTKNSNYSDVLYVNELCGDNTINTMPPLTLNAFKDHGEPTDIKNDMAEAIKIMNKLKDLGINFNKLCNELLDEGVKIFADAFDKLLNSLDEKMKKSFKEQ